MDSPLAFMQFEASYIILFIIGITIIEYIFSGDPDQDNGLVSHTPIDFTIAACSTTYSSAERYSWTNTELNLNNEQVAQTPIQRIRGLRYLSLEQRTKLMSGVRRRLDQEF